METVLLDPKITDEMLVFVCFQELKSQLFTDKVYALFLVHIKETLRNLWH